MPLHFILRVVIVLPLAGLLVIDLVRALDYLACQLRGVEILAAIIRQSAAGTLDKSEVKIYIVSYDVIFPDEFIKRCHGLACGRSSGNHIVSDVIDLRYHLRYMYLRINHRMKSLDRLSITESNSAYLYYLVTPRIQTSSLSIEDNERPAILCVFYA